MIKLSKAWLQFVAPSCTITWLIGMVSLHSPCPRDIWLNSIHSPPTAIWHFDVETKHAVLVGALFWSLCEVAIHWHPAARAKGATNGGFNPDVDYQPLHLLCSDSVRHEAHRDGDGLCLYWQQPTKSRTAFKSQWPVLVPVWPVTDPIIALWGV